MPAVGTGASDRLSVKCHSGHALLPLEVIRELGDVVNCSESTETKAMLLTAHVLRLLLLPSAGSSLTHSLCGQSVIQRKGSQIGGSRGAEHPAQGPRSGKILGV